MGPTWRLQYPLDKVLGHIPLEILPDGAAAMNRVEDPGPWGVALVGCAPSGSLGAYGDNGVLLYAHLLVLVVLALKGLTAAVCSLVPGSRSSASAAHHYESEQFPVLSVSVRDERYFWVLEDVPDAFESGYGYVFRLLVEGYEDRSPRQGEAHGYRVRFAHPSEVARRATLWRTRKAA